MLAEAKRQRAQRQTWQEDMRHQVSKAIDDVAHLEGPEECTPEKLEI